MSEKNIGTLNLTGKEGYNTGVKQLDDMCKPYGTNARSIKVEDINRVTGFNPNSGNGMKDYKYYPDTLTKFSTGREEGISKSSLAYKAIFNDSYFLASIGHELYACYEPYFIRQVNHDCVDVKQLYDDYKGSYSYIGDWVRAVVSL